MVAGGSPVRLALLTASGPVSASTARATGCSGMRTATVPRVSPRSQASDGAARTMSVSPPGQNVSTRLRMLGVTSSAKPSSPRQEPTSTGTGMSRPRPFAASNLSTAGGEKASAAMP